MKSSVLVSHPLTFNSKGRSSSGEAAFERILMGTRSLRLVGFVLKIWCRPRSKDSMFST
jgi:hypothetical protein